MISRVASIVTVPVLVVAGAMAAVVPALGLLAMSGLAFFAAVAAPVSWVAMSIVVLLSGTYRGVFLALRVPAGGLPISLLDGLMMLLLAAVIVRARRPLENLQPLLLPLALICVCAFVGLVISILMGQPLYNAIKFLRAEIYLVGGCVAARLLVSDSMSRTMLLKALVIGGTLTALSQIMTFMFAAQGTNIWALLGISYRGDDSVVSFAVTVQNTASFRDLGVGIPFTVFAVAILFASLLSSRPLFRPALMMPLLLVCLLGIMLSLTRTVWVGAAIVFLVGFATAQSQDIIRGVARFMPVMVLGVLAFALLFLTGSLTSGVLEVLVVRFDGLTTLGTDLTLGSRLDEARATLSLIGSNWWSGVGAADVVVRTEGLSRDVIVRNQLHNGYLNYFLVAGLPGLASVLLLLSTSILTSWREARASLDPEARMAGLGVFLALVAICFMSLTGGIINDAFVTPVVGVIVGLSPIAVAEMKPAVAPKLSFRTKRSMQGQGA